jgi:TPR repeat protein
MSIRSRIVFAVMMALLLRGSPGWADYLGALESYNLGDYQGALKEFRPMAEEGNAAAQLLLGFMYERGQGVPQDFVQAHLWFNLAARQGEEKAGKMRDEVGAKMTPAQVAEANRLAAQWKPKIVIGE